MYDVLAGSAGLGRHRFPGPRPRPWRCLPACAPKASRAASLLGRPVRRCPAGAWRSRAPRRPRRAAAQPLRRHRPDPRRREGGRRRARTAKPARPSRCARAAWSMPPASGSMPCGSRTAPPPAARRAMVAPSQGVHLVVDREFLPGDHALMVPKTATAACCSPCRGSASSSWAPPTRRAATWRGAAALSRGVRLHPGRIRPLPAQCADSRRRAQRLGRPAAAGQAPR
jgi:hypothetical protein